ncbi:MAG: FumA C-terminus/TtdB family hydratase beta subunit [Verrucomicrobiae bacterium]|nr:FumA C-terminus/TtdB family hydratase beta subunit [Verrucomicrobiae bacterium]
MPRFTYMPLFPASKERIPFRQLEGNFVSVRRERARTVLHVSPRALAALAEAAFHDVMFYFRRRHLEQLAAIVTDPQASDNDRFVARSLLENAVIAAEGILPACQDTGTATIIAERGYNVSTRGDDAAWLSRGVRAAYTRYNFRPSQVAPLNMLEDVNTGNNLPAQIEIQAVPGNVYRFLFIAKGGGSANKTMFFQETRAILADEQRLLEFLEEKIRTIGVAGCPPYHLAIVIGGTSPEMTLKTLKLATADALDTLTTRPSGRPHAYRDLDWEEKILTLSRKLGLGAQFGGRHFALDVRVIRMPHHAASLPIAIGVSCNAHRNILGKITPNGVFLEKLETNPQRLLDNLPALKLPGAVPINLDQPIDQIAAELARLPLGTRLSLSGTLVVARDAAHARLYRLLREGKPLPDYFLKHPVYYAGPARTPKGMASGSFGPTTAQRMDPYVAEFMKHGASRIMLGKGNRSPAVAEACRRYNGFYLGAIGGSAALVASRHIESSEVLDFHELGMEAVRKIRVRNLPAFLVGDNQGRTLYPSGSAVEV